MTDYPLRPAALTVGLFFCVLAAHAEDDVETLNPVYVHGDGAAQPVTTEPEGSYRLDRHMLDDYGSANGSVTEALEVLPNIQFSEDRYEPESLYDLKPASISISGGRAYENNFQLDGVDINSRLDPLADNPNSITDVPGHEQSLFIDEDMLESVTVYDSNVPARFGNFTGGVVDMKTRRAGQGPRRINLSYSTTRSDWVDYRVFHHVPEDAENPSAPPEPDSFKRDRMGISVDQPLAGGRGVYLGATRSYSRNPDVSLGEIKDQEQENLGLNGRFYTPVWDQGWLDLGLAVAPYEGEYFIKDAKDSDFSVRGGGLTGNGKLSWLTDRHDITARLAVSLSENSRRSPQHFFNWQNSPSRHWGIENDLAFSRQGGFGDLDRQQRRYTFGLDAQRQPVQWLGRRWNLEYGLDLSYVRVLEDRPSTSYIYQNGIVNTDIECRGISLDCVEGEQFFSTRNVYQAHDLDVGLAQAAAYTEASTYWGRVKTVFGARYDYDDFLGNLNLSPRFRGAFDVFGDGRTHLTFGANRYHSAPLLSYKLREARVPHYTEYRGSVANVVGDWESDSGGARTRYVFSDLNTPYSDELTVGVKQSFLGGILDVRYIHREGHDELSQERTDVQQDGFEQYRLTNDGSSRYQGVSLAWYRTFGRYHLGLSTTWSEAETSNSDYDVSADNPLADEYIYYQGKRMRQGELEQVRYDYNRPLVANISLAADLHRNLRASLVTTWRDEQRYIANSGRSEKGETITLPNGQTVTESLPVYEDRDRPATWISNLKLTWQVTRKPGLVLDAQINNVFNARTYTADDGNPDTYDSGIEIGRNYWLGMKVRL